MKEKIDFDKFMEINAKLEIKYGTIKVVERINKKMLKFSVDFGEDSLRTVVANIGNKFEDEGFLVGYQFPFITNLVPAMISGFESQAMIMVVENIEGEIILQNTNYPTGSKLF